MLGRPLPSQIIMEQAEYCSVKPLPSKTKEDLYAPVVPVCLDEDISLDCIKQPLSGDIVVE